MSADASNVEDMNIPQITERLSMSCIASSGERSNTFRNRSLTLFKNDRDLRKRFDSVEVSESPSLFDRGLNPLSHFFLCAAQVNRLRLSLKLNPQLSLLPLLWSVRLVGNLSTPGSWPTTPEMTDQNLENPGHETSDSGFKFRPFFVGKCSLSRACPNSSSSFSVN